MRGFIVYGLRFSIWGLRSRVEGIQGYLAHDETPPSPQGPPYGHRHRHRLTVGSSGGVCSYGRGTPAGLRVEVLSLGFKIEGQEFMVWG